MNKVKILTSSTFEKLEGVQVILNSDGLYRQVDLFKKQSVSYGAVLYAKHSGGFITLKTNNNTSKKSIKIDSFVLVDSIDFSYQQNALGFLEIAE